MATSNDSYTGYEPPDTSASRGPRPPRRRRGGIVLLLAAALFVGAVTGAAVSTLIDDPAPAVAEQPIVEPATPASQVEAAPAPGTLDPAAIGRR